MKWIGMAVGTLALLPQVMAAQDADAGGPGFEIQGPAFLALQVQSMDGAASWYERAFSLDVVNEIEAADGRYRIRILDSPSLTVELIETRDLPLPPQRHVGLFKFGFFVDDIDAALRWFQGVGADTDASPFVDEVLAARSFLMRDPEGNRLQAFQRCDQAC